MTNLPEPPIYGDQREMLIAFIDVQRETLLWKLVGLSDHQLRARNDVTGFSLLGLLKHLIRVERSWFQVRLMGEELDADPNDDTAWIPTTEETFERLAIEYREAWERSNTIARDLPLDHHTVVHSATYGARSLQWVLLHMLEEVARHLGHADVIRQSIDGATGVNAAYERRRTQAQMDLPTNQKEP